jgi:hypothetical protein
MGILPMIHGLEARSTSTASRLIPPRRALAGAFALATGFSPWDSRAAGFCQSRLQPGFSIMGFIHTPSYVAGSFPNEKLYSLTRRW